MRPHGHAPHDAPRQRILHEVGESGSGLLFLVRVLLGIFELMGHRDGLDNVQPGAAEQLVDDRPS